MLVATSSVAEPPGAPTFRVEAEPIFVAGRSQEPEPPFLRRLWLNLFGKQKGKLCSCDKHDLRTIYKGKYDPKNTSINNSLFESSK